MNWYVLYTRYGAENRVQLHLKRQEFETYLPLFKKKYVGAKRVYYEPRPLFPTYAFVRLDLNMNGWRDVLSVSGVRKLVDDVLGKPVQVPDEDIIGLKSREYAGFIRMPDWPKFHNGQCVRVTEGPLIDNLAQVDYMDDRERVRVFTEFMGRKTPAWVLSRHLEPADNQMTVKGGCSPKRAFG